MRILYLCGDQGIPVFGRKGASTHMREMITAFRELGHEICLAAPDLGGDRRPDEDFLLVKLPRPRSRLLGLDGRYLLANGLSRRILRDAVAEFKPDAIYERSALYFTAGEWLARKTGLPRILEVNSFLAREQRTRLHFPALAERFENRIITRSRATAAISRHMKNAIAGMGANPASVRPYPMAVKPERFQLEDDGGRLRHHLGWTADDLVLGYVGSMNTYHRPNWFMDLAEKFLRREERQVRFLIVGGSASKVQRHRSRLLQWVNEGRVHFTGSVPQADLGDWISAMDVVLVPGAAPQSTPTKIFEAAAVGRPMILPATEPIKEICGETAPYLFEPDDFRAFEEKVRDFFARPESFQEPSKRLHDKVVEEYTWRKHAQNLVKWFEELRGSET